MLTILVLVCASREGNHQKCVNILTLFFFFFKYTERHHMHRCRKETGEYRSSPKNTDIIFLCKL